MENSIHMKRNNKMFQNSGMLELTRKSLVDREILLKL